MIKIAKDVWELKKCKFLKNAPYVERLQTQKFSHAYLATTHFVPINGSA